MSRSPSTLVLAGLLGSLALAMELESAAPVTPPSIPAGIARLSTTQLEGTANLRRNVPVVGATVTVRPQSGASPLFITTTDSKGYFKATGLEADSYRVEIRRPGLKPVVKEMVPVRSPFRAVVEVMMETLGDDPSTPPAPPKSDGVVENKPVRFEGRVMSVGGDPLVEARVRLVRADATADPQAVPSEGDGSFGLNGLPRGHWRLEVLGPGFLPVRSSLDLEADTRVTVVLVPQPANYVAVPLDLLPDEEPIPPP